MSGPALPAPVRLAVVLLAFVLAPPVASAQQTPSSAAMPRAVSSATAVTDAATPTTVAHDSFGRTVAASWGRSDSGGVYLHPFGGSRTAVSGGVGLMRLGANTSAQAVLQSPIVADGSVGASVRFSRIPTTGAGVFAGPMIRTSGRDGYRLRLHVAAGGLASLQLHRVTGSGSTVTQLAGTTSRFKLKAGQPVYLRIQATGTTTVQLSGRAWFAGRWTPMAAVQAADSSDTRVMTPGLPALWGGSTSDSGANTLSFDSLTATSLDRPTPPAPPQTVVALATGSPDAGALPVGSSAYPVPSGAIVVSPSGSDTAAGTQAAPLRTLAAAIGRATSGSTIVLRAGRYHESLLVPSPKSMTIQAYPNEAVWLDGSSPVTGFAPSGGRWVRSGWNTDFDSSPTEVRGAPDSTVAGWQWVNPAYPMAAHPDQVWLDGEPQRQVATREQVIAGTFFVDPVSDVLVLGSDPTGRRVEASTLQRALIVTAPNTVIRGIGIRRYAPSMPDFGAVRVPATGVTFENVVVAESSTVGLKVSGAQATLNRVTAVDNGLLGIGAHRADGLRMTRVRAERNNAEHFNPSPGSGGVKITSSRGVRIADSVFSDNVSNGLWFDCSVYDAVVSRSDIKDNGWDGLIVELSGYVTVTNNVITGNAHGGLLVLDTNNLRVWNNAIRGGLLPLRVSDGKRIATDLSAPGHDTRQPLPDPLVTWVTKDVEIKNNVVGDARQGLPGQNWCGLVCVLDDRRILTAEQMNARLDGNVYRRLTSAELPTPTVRWASGSTAPRDFVQVDGLRSATGQELRGAQVTGSAPFVDGVRSTTIVAGVPIPRDIAALGSLPAGGLVGPRH